VLHFECLDTADPAACADYERAFHEAFSRVTGNRLVRTLWQWDDARQRLATRIPYADQVVFVARDGHGRIETAIAANVALHAFQSAAFGFPHPVRVDGCCELLTFFTVQNFRLDLKLRFWAACFAELRQRGLRTAYATTAARVLPIYRRMGGDVIGETVRDGEARYFLRFSLARHWMRARPHTFSASHLPPPASPQSA